MRGIDPDIAAAVKMVFEARRSHHVGRIREKQAKQLEAEIATQIELLSDEVEEVIPKNHPSFQLVLMLAVAEKLKRLMVEPEYKSCLEFPEGL
jgi:hypothetical protein